MLETKGYDFDVLFLCLGLLSRVSIVCCVLYLYEYLLYIDGIGIKFEQEVQKTKVGCK